MIWNQPSDDQIVAAVPNVVHSAHCYQKKNTLFECEVYPWPKLKLFRNFSKSSCFLAIPKIVSWKTAEIGRSNYSFGKIHIIQVLKYGEIKILPQQWSKNQLVIKLSLRSPIKSYPIIQSLHLAPSHEVVLSIYQSWCFLHSSYCY